MNDGPVAVIGAGGHGKVVVSSLLAAGVEVAAILDDDASRHGTRVLGVPVRGPVSALASLGCERAVVGVGDNCTRERLAAEIGALWTTVVHPTVWLDPTVQLGAGTVVFAGVVIQPDAVIGAHAIINTGATVDHDCIVGDFVHLAPGVHLSGGVTVGKGALLGIGSAVIPGIRIGAWATVAAGAVVLKDVADGATVAGVPARPLEKKG